jgi:hypothetical protein
VRMKTISFTVNPSHTQESSATTVLFMVQYTLLYQLQRLFIIRLNEMTIMCSEQERTEEEVTRVQ